MPKPTKVLSTEVIAKGGLLEVEIQSGDSKTFVAAKGLESLPQLGQSGGFTDARSVDEIDTRDVPTIIGTEELEFIFKRIGDDPVQAALLKAAQEVHTERDKKIVKFKAYYNSGDTVESELLLNGWYIGEVANDNESIQMLGIKGKPQGKLITGQVA